jgi:hypothetical protein
MKAFELAFFVLCSVIILAKRRKIFQAISREPSDDQVLIEAKNPS